MEVLKYIVSGEVPGSFSPEVHSLETVVSKIKRRPEVTKRYMQQWDRERILNQETRKEVIEEVTKEVTKEVALEVIRFGREDGVSDEKIRKRLETRFNLATDVIDELFQQVDNKE